VREHKELRRRPIDLLPADERAKGASRESFFAAMALVPKGEVAEGDELPNASSGEQEGGDHEAPSSPCPSDFRREYPDTPPGITVTRNSNGGRVS
jgi:hypothetical protein